jgi:hypothetical protein
MLDRIELAIDDRSDAEEYVRALIEGMSEQRFPSPQLLDRVSALVEVLERRYSR